MATIDIKDEQMHTLVSAAILQLLTPEKREELITQGIVNLLKGSTSSFDKRSELERIFELSFHQAAQGIIRKLIEEDSVVMAQITGVINAAITKVFAESHREKLVERLSHVLTENLWKDR